MSAIGAGFAALRRRRLVLLLALTSVVLGFLSATPLRPALQRQVAGTLAGAHFLANDAELAPAEAIDFFREEWSAVKGAATTAWWAAVVGVLLQVLYAGGIVETLGRAAPAPAPSDFWAASRRHFGHNLKCLVLFGLAASIVEGIWLGIAFAVRRSAFRTAPPNTPGRAAVTWIAVVVAVLLFGLLTLVYDFARAARRTDPAVGAMAAFGRARRRLRGRWLRGVALLGFWSLAGAISTGLLVAAAWGQRTQSGGAVALNLLLLLLALTARSATRVGAWGSVLALFDASPVPAPAGLAVPAAVVAPAPPPEPIPEEEPSPRPVV